MAKKAIRNEVLCNIIAAFISCGYQLVFHQLEVTSRHFAAGLNIPIHNTSIYVTKLYSLRCLLTSTGCLVEYVIYRLIKKPDGSNQNRIYLSITNFALLLFCRLVFLVALHCSTQPAYHMYVVLSIETFFCGALMSIIAIVPEHTIAVVLGSNVSRIVIPLFQFALDTFLYDRPLLMIKIHAWICVFMTLAALILWILFTRGSLCASESGEPEASTEIKSVESAGFSETMRAALSPFLMFPGGSLFKDFLYPGVLPYAVLARDKCHVINLLASLLYPAGSLTLYMLESVGMFSSWSYHFDLVWIACFPVGVILIFSLLAIHTRIPSASRIVNSRPIVMAMTLSVMLFYSYMYPLSFAGISKIIKSGFGRRRGNVGVLTLHSILVNCYRFFFSKISVGYNDTRVSLGYHLPRFRPSHRMSGWNTFWYIFNNTFRRSWRDIRNDLRLDIRNYL